MKVRIDYAICNSCGLCREVCPESAIRPMLLEPRHLYEVQEIKCTGCGDCLDYCPAPGRSPTPQSFIPRNRPCCSTNFVEIASSLRSSQ